MVIKYTNIYHSKAIKNLPKFGIFGLKTNHLATLVAPPSEQTSKAKALSSAVATNFYDREIRSQRCKNLRRHD
jgi:hypothetical protein